MFEGERRQPNNFETTINPQMKLTDKFKKYFRNSVLGLMVTQAGFSPQALAEKLGNEINGDEIIKITTDNKKIGELAKYNIDYKMDWQKEEINKSFKRLDQLEIDVQLLNDVLILPKQLESELMFLFRTNSKKTFSLLEKKMEEKILAKTKKNEEIKKLINCESIPQYVEENFISREMLKCIDPKIAQMILERLPKKISVPNHLIDFCSEINDKSKTINLYISCLDLKTKKHITEDKPIIIKFDELNNPDALSDKIIEAVYQTPKLSNQFMRADKESLSEKSTRKPIRNKNYNIQFKPDNERLVKPANEMFTLDEQKILNSLSNKGGYLELNFNINGERNILKIDLKQLAQIGRLKLDNVDFIHLKTAGGEYGRLTIAHWDQYKAFENFEKNEGKHNFNPKIILDIVKGQVNFGYIMKLEKIIHQKIKEYHFYQIKETLSDTTYSDYHDINEAIGETEKMEIDFGYKPGDLVKRIMVDYSAASSGGIYSRFDTLSYRIGPKDHLKNYDHGLVARHEMAHLIDDRFDITDQDGQDIDSLALYKFFVKSDLKNLYALAESNMDVENKRLMPKAGHPADNLGEFFASAINSLYIKNPEIVLQKKDTSFLEFYKQSLLQIINRLTKINAIPEKAPIFKRISERLIIIEKILNERTK